MCHGIGNMDVGVIGVGAMGVEVKRKTRGISPPTVWVPGIKLRPSSLIAGVFTC